MLLLKKYVNVILFILKTLPGNLKIFILTNMINIANNLTIIVIKQSKTFKSLFAFTFQFLLYQLKTR